MSSHGYWQERHRRSVRSLRLQNSLNASPLQAIPRRLDARPGQGVKSGSRIASARSSSARCARFPRLSTSGECLGCFAFWPRIPGNGSMTRAPPPLGLGQWTTQKYTDVAQRLDCVRTLHPWYTNDLKRLVKRPTLHCLDSALLAAPRNLSPARLNCDRMVFGALLETFVRGERLTLARWNSEPIDFWGPL